MEYVPLFAVVILGIAIVFIICAIVLRPRGHHSGLNLFLVRAFLPMLMAAIHSGTAVLIFSIDDFGPYGEMPGDRLGIAFLIFIASCFYLLFPFIRVFTGLFHRTWPLQDIQLPKGNGSKFRFAHLSDLHLTGEKTLEHDIPSGVTMARGNAAIRWALSSADMVFITGDITDSGSTEDWKVYYQILSDLDEPDLNRIHPIPGNHDLCLPPSLATTFSTQNGYVLTSPLWVEDRCRAYVQNVFSRCPDTWRLSGDYSDVTVRQVMTNAESYIKVYNQHPPYVMRIVGPRGRIFDKLVVHDGLKRAAEKVPAEIPCPSSGRLLFRDLLELSFPLVMLETNNVMVIGLNSCIDQDQDILGNALGLLGSDQISRLNSILTLAPDDHTIIILLHHHIGFPPTIRRAFKKTRPWISAKALQLRDAKKLLEVLKSKNNLVVLHGHKHIAYGARFDSSVVLSAGSVLDPKMQFGRPPCFVYGISGNGQVVVEDSMIPTPH